MFNINYGVSNIKRHLKCSSYEPLNVLIILDSPASFNAASRSSMLYSVHASCNARCHWSHGKAFDQSQTAVRLALARSKIKMAAPLYTTICCILSIKVCINSPPTPQQLFYHTTSLIYMFLRIPPPSKVYRFFQEPPNKLFRISLLPPTLVF